MADAILKAFKKNVSIEIEMSWNIICPVDTVMDLNFNP